MAPPRRSRRQAGDAHSEKRNGWADKVLAGDEASRIQRQEHQAELEREMQARGLDYADMAATINERWTSTKEDAQGQRETMQSVYGGSNAQISVSAKEKLATSMSFYGNEAGGGELRLIDASIPVARYRRFIGMSAVLLATGTVLGCCYLSLAATLGVLITLGLLIVTRHFYIIRERKPAQANLEAVIKSGEKRPAQDLSRFPAVSYLYVLGSGGHTTEMIALIKLSFKANKNQHLRFITNGDLHSMSQLKALEGLLQKTYPDGSAGTRDTLIATRAREVYQSYLKSVKTSLQCALEILIALTTIPAARADQPNAEEFSYPHVIVTNGPGTGFIVALMAHVLKILYLAPQNRMKVVFFETWARTHHLGLTGKLLYWTGIADLFVVQSQTLSKTVGKPSIGSTNMRYAQIGRTARVTCKQE